MSVEKGTIKVVWVTKDTSRIYSKMFDSIEAAAEFASSRKYCLAFRLLWHRKYETYCWEILPLGKHRLYKSSIKFYQKHGGAGAVSKIFRRNRKTS